MPKIKCKYCDKSVEEKGIKRHNQSRACLIRQNKNIEVIIECDWCGDQFPRKDTLSRHITICKRRLQMNTATIEDNLRTEIRQLTSTLADRNEKIQQYEDTINELETEIKILHTEINVLKENPRTVININKVRIDKFVVKQYAKDNFVPLTENLLKQCLIKPPNARLLLGGPVAIAKLILDSCLSGNNKLAFTDTSRLKGYWKDIDSSIIEDSNVNKLAKKLTRPIYDPYNDAFHRDDSLDADETVKICKTLAWLYKVSVGEDTRSKDYKSFVSCLVADKCNLAYMLQNTTDDK